MRHSVFACVMLAAASACAGENYALLVAVGDYDVKELRPLRYTRADVLDFHKALVDSGFPAKNIVLMHDDLKQLVAHYEKVGGGRDPKHYLPLRANIDKQLELLLGRLRRDDSVVVAFAGHGVQFKGENKSYYCPVDAKLDDKASLIAFERVFSELKESAATRKLFLVDACQNDPLTAISRSRQTVELESVTRPQTESVPEGIIALFSCKAGQRSFELPELGHGLFFYHVLDGWKGKGDLNKDGKLSYQELAVYTEKQTAEYAANKLQVLQTPQLKAEFSGEWILRNLPASPEPARPSVTNVTGRYYSQKYGWLVLTQKGDQVSGEMTYQNGNKGKMTGTVSGRTMTLQWNNGADSGTAKLTLSADANELSGNWIGKNSRDDWSLIRK